MNSSLAASSPGPASRLVNLLLSIKPLANLAKQRARAMMIDRAEAIGVPWREHTQQLQSRGGSQTIHLQWDSDLTQLTNPNLVYPDYYVTSFHGYDEGNLGWLPALEVESASRAVHAKIWPELGAKGDSQLRALYHETLTAHLPMPPQHILDLGCGAGLSTFALQAYFPEASVTGLDLSPYFLAVAQYQAQQYQAQQYQAQQYQAQQTARPGLQPDSQFNSQPGLQLDSQVDSKPDSRQPSPTLNWVHAAAENTGLPDQSFDLISLCLVAHELPQSATTALFQEAHRLLTPGGHLAVMDMNPSCEFVQKLPPYVLTLLKSTEPYLDQYFGLDLAEIAEVAGLQMAHLSPNGPRHRTFIAKKAI
ncbi:MAG: class I SAM-dependent methyltransferase [Prochlorothrix sp.]